MTRFTARTAVRLVVVFLWCVAGVAEAQHQSGPPLGIPKATAAEDTGLFAHPDTSLFPIARYVPDTTFVGDTSLVFAIETGNRLYPDWKEDRRVHLGERFPLGDTDMTAVVTRFFPDFRLLDGRAVSASRQLANPAIHVFTFRDTTAIDSSWAFLNFPPHFSPRSFFTYQLKEVAGYRGAPDSTAVLLKSVGADAPEGKATNAKTAKAKTAHAKGGSPN